MDSIVFTVLGTPRAQPRGRGVGRRRPVSVTSPVVALWRGAVERAAREAVAAVSPLPAWCHDAVRVDMVLTFPTPKRERWGTLHTPKPDKDNAEKLVLDCMERAGLLPRGDSRVSRGEPVKVWGERGSLAVTMVAGVAPMIALKAEAPAWLASE